MSGAYQLTVKSPDDRVPAHSVSCSPSWTVLQLKTHLSEVYPSHPPPSGQRLIHAGKLLKDEILIKSLFTNPEEAQTIHLVCRTSSTSSQPKKTTETHITHDIPPAELERYQQEYYRYLQNFFLTNGAMTTTSVCNTPGVNRVSPATSPQAFWYTQPTWSYTAAGQQPWNYWYHPAAYGYPATETVPSPTSTPTEPDGGAANAAGPGAGWMQGARAMLAGFGVGGQGQAAEAPVNGAVPDEAQQPQAQQQQQQQQQAMMVGNPMVGGFMGAEEFGDGAENMDIVDRFYMLFRLCLFIGLCFAYSSLDKAIIVFSVAAYVYFYNIYRRHAAIRRAVAAEAQPNQGREAQPPADQPPSESDQTINSNTGNNGVTSGDGDSDQQVRARVTTPNTPEESSPVVAPAEPARIERLTGTIRMVMSTSYQFFSSLLTSLIPEQPPPIRLE